MKTSMAEQTGESWRGRVGRMDAQEIDEFFTGGRICRLACLDDDGWPYIVPVWFQWAGGGFFVIPRERSIWAGYLKRDGRVSLSIDEDGAPYRKVMVKGVAELVEEPNVGGRWVEIARDMSYRYLGEHDLDYLEPTLGEPRWLFFIRPEKLTTWQGVDWAKKYKTAS